MNSQVVILDDLIVAEDKRVDCAPGAERKNVVFECALDTRCVLYQCAKILDLAAKGPVTFMLHAAQV